MTSSSTSVPAVLRSSALRTFFPSGFNATSLLSTLPSSLYYPLAMRHSSWLVFRWSRAPALQSIQAPHFIPKVRFSELSSSEITIAYLNPLKVTSNRTLPLTSPTSRSSQTCDSLACKCTGRHSQSTHFRRSRPPQFVRLCLTSIPLPLLFVVTSARVWQSADLPMEEIPGWGSRWISARMTFGHFTSLGPFLSRADPHLIRDIFTLIAVGSRWFEVVLHTLFHGDFHGSTRTAAFYAVTRRVSKATILITASMWSRTSLMINVHTYWHREPKACVVFDLRAVFPVHMYALTAR
ncbi:hypothetical protein K438DRAFT_1832259 [Mycena galopus ATCC 62051]|nr:hypothetical protein K438DRAFT_1832259 [Mycena galopus ATCC 62051]